VISAEWRQTLIQALVLGVVAAVVVWFLEDFNRRRLVDDWTRFVEGWGSQPLPGPMGDTHGG
jgi:C4-dicarboxylate transporter